MYHAIGVFLQSDKVVHVAGDVHGLKPCPEGCSHAVVKLQPLRAGCPHASGRQPCGGCAQLSRVGECRFTHGMTAKGLTRTTADKESAGKLCASL